MVGKELLTTHCIAVVHSESGNTQMGPGIITKLNWKLKAILSWLLCVLLSMALYAHIGI